MINKAWFQAHQSSISLSLLGLYFLVNGFINSTTVLMEAMRTPPLPFAQWEPFAWEYTSAVGSFCVVIALAKILNHFPWQWERFTFSIALYSAVGLCFAATHIIFMIVSREIIYALVGGNYQFATSAEQWFFELIYEMRKDLWSFIFFVVMIWCYRYVVAQWLGNASNIGLESAKLDQRNTQNALDEKAFKHELLLIKKNGHEFLIKKQDINWMASSGNYVNLHIDDKVYPMRNTLTSFLDENAYLPFARVHRSFAVNLNDVESVKVGDSGDGVITLKNGHTVKMSRRYKLAIDK